MNKFIRGNIHMMAVAFL